MVCLSHEKDPFFIGGDAVYLFIPVGFPDERVPLVLTIVFI